jgi:hypothetical protein
MLVQYGQHRIVLLQDVQESVYKRAHRYYAADGTEPRVQLRIGGGEAREAGDAQHPVQCAQGCCAAGVNLNTERGCQPPLLWSWTQMLAKSVCRFTTTLVRSICVPI